MNSLRLVPASTLILFALIAVGSLHAQVIFDDSLADGDRAMTGLPGTDTSWWTSSSLSGIDDAVGSLGLVTGTSGRGIHTVFDTQTLANVGDKLTATYTFTTPATVGGSGSARFRVGLFDTLGRAGLDADLEASSGTPNQLYGWNVGLGNPGVIGLPGYMLDMDVNTLDADLSHRDHDVNSATGRLLATTSGFVQIQPTGENVGYDFLANTTYTGTFSIERTGASELTLRSTLEDVGPNTFTTCHSNVDSAPDSFDIGFLGFHANSNVFGTSNVPDTADNGIDFSNIKVVFRPAPTPCTVFDDSLADGDRAETNFGGENDTDWWTSSSPDGIEASTGSLGLVTGASSRGIHTVFTKKTLTNVGDKVTANYTFTTPTTVSDPGGSAAIRVGLFDSLDRAALDADVASSTAFPNAAYGWVVANGGPGDPGLPGYMLDMDVNPLIIPEADLNFRTHNVLSATGLLLANTTGGLPMDAFTSFNSGPDAGYGFLPNTSYTGSFSVERISSTCVELRGTLGGDSYVVADTTVTSSPSFDFLGFHINSGQFGLNSLPGEADNGIDFTNINVTFTINALGDANDNGVVNNSDIADFASALFTPAAYALAFPGVDPDIRLDFNCDGVFNNSDIAGFASALGF